MLQNSRCTRHCAAFASFCQKRRLVGEDRLYCFAEKGVEFIVKALVNQPDETGHRLGIEDIRCGRFILGYFSMVFPACRVLL